MPFLDLPSGLQAVLQDRRSHRCVDEPDTVLFVHGFTECTEAWRAWVPHFSRRFRMVRTTSAASASRARWPKTSAHHRTLRRRSGARHQARRQRPGARGRRQERRHRVMSARDAARRELVKTITVACSPVTPPNVTGWIEDMERTSMRAWARTQRERMGSKMPPRRHRLVVRHDGTHRAVDGARLHAVGRRHRPSRDSSTSSARRW